MHTHFTRQAFNTGNSPEHRLIRMGGNPEAADGAADATAAEIRSKTDALLGTEGVNNEAKTGAAVRSDPDQPAQKHIQELQAEVKKLRSEVEELQRKTKQDVVSPAADPLAQQQEEGSENQSPLPTQTEESEGDQSPAQGPEGNQSPLPVQTEEATSPSAGPTVQPSAPAVAPTPSPAATKTAEQQRQEADQALIKGLSPNMRDLVNRLPAFMRGYAASVISAFAGLGSQPLAGPASGPGNTPQGINKQEAAKKAKTVAEEAAKKIKTGAEQNANTDENESDDAEEEVDSTRQAIDKAVTDFGIISPDRRMGRVTAVDNSDMEGFVSLTLAPFLRGQPNPGAELRQILSTLIAPALMVNEGENAVRIRAVNLEQVQRILNALVRPAAGTPEGDKKQAEAKAKTETLDTATREAQLKVLNETSAKNSAGTTQAVETFYSRSTQANYDNASYALISEYQQLCSMVDTLPDLLEGDDLQSAAREVAVRLTMIEEITQSTEKMWAAHEVRATQVNKVMQALRTSSLGELDAVLKSFRGMAAEWATQDGSPPTAFNGVIRMAESVVAERRAQEEVRKSALAYRQSALDQLRSVMGGVRNNIARQEKEIAALSFRALSPSSWLEAPISSMSGTSAGMRKTLEIDKNLLGRMEGAERQIATIPDALGTQSPKARIEQISKIMQGVLRVNYDEANKVLASAQAALKTTDAVIREVAEWVPGGSLGIGLAEMRMNPDSPEAQRKFMMGIAMTAIDLIPIPGIGQVAGRAAGRLTLSATSRAAPVIVRRAIATGVAAGTKRLVEGGIKAGLQRGAELAADRVLGTEAESKVSATDLVQDATRAAGRQAARTAARETVRAILPRRSRGLENLAARWAGRLANAGIKAAFEANQPDGPRT